MFKTTEIYHFLNLFYTFQTMAIRIFLRWCQNCTNVHYISRSSYLSRYFVKFHVILQPYET